MDGFVKLREQVLETDGSNLMMTLAHEGVDHTRTCTNDVIEIMEGLNHTCFSHDCTEWMF